MLLSYKNYEVLQSLFAGVHPILPPVEVDGEVVGSVVSISRITDLILQTIQRFSEPVIFPKHCICRSLAENPECTCLPVACWKED